MNADKKFDLLYETLKDIIKTYYENVMRTIAFILLAIGWILTSKDTQTLLHKDERLIYLGLTAIVITGLIHGYSSHYFYQHSQKKAQQLKELDFVSSNYYEQYQIKFSVFMGNLILNLSLLTVLFVMVYLNKPGT